MLPSTILTAASIMDLAPARAAWRDGNNAGEGYDPEGDDLGEPYYAARSDDDVSIYCDGEDVVLVGNSSGPWAIRIRA